jgi:hypothetical protein
MDSNNIDWLVLYLPQMSNITDSNNKIFRKIYDRLHSDITAMTGVQGERCIRFYSSTKRRYVDINHASVSFDEYWRDALNMLASILGQSLESRIAQFLEQKHVIEAR